MQHIAVQGNSEKTLVLRQRWALTYLQLNHQYKNVWNIDETWLGMMDFRRRHWAPRHHNYSVKLKKLQPRISMITAVDKEGEVLVCLTQSNSNRSMMGVFMQHFVQRLDR